MSEKTVSLPVYLTSDDRDRIKVVADALGKGTAAELVRDAVSEYFVKHNHEPLNPAVSRARGGNRRSQPEIIPA